jgi:cell division protein FtsZ
MEILMLEVIHNIVANKDLCSIKVIGIGGGGGNAIDHMIRSGVPGVKFIAMNTDAQALEHNLAPQKLRLGKTGLGAKGKPDVGRDAAIGERERIAEALQGADMVFIAAGMGGGTGTGAAPVVAEIAREMDILTVAMVTRPFAFEGQRSKVAEVGIVELLKYVDSLIVILNNKLFETLDAEVSMDEAFKAADDVLKNAVVGIAGIIDPQKAIYIDIDDLRVVMRKGMAMVGSAAASGVGRARIAVEQAIAFPLCESFKPADAKGMLVNITVSRSLKMKEVNEVVNTVREFSAEDAHLIFGVAYEENMEDELRVTIIATGLEQSR